MCLQNYNYTNCKVIQKRIKHIDIRLFEEEIDIVKFVALSLNLSYDQLFVKFCKEYAEHNFAQNKNYKFNL